MLHMTGPAISQQLRRIEAEVGVRVVAPLGRGVRLTSEGRVLADYAAQVSELMIQAENDLRQSDELVGQIRIAALASTIRTSLTTKLPTFQRLHPRVHLSVEDGETADHLSRLVAGSLDLAIAESWSPTPLQLPNGVTARRLAREPALVALPAQHPLQSGKRLDVADLASEPWATCARDSDGHRALMQIARKSGVELDIRHFVADHTTQLALVRAGLAIACVPEPVTTAEAPGITYRTLAPVMHRDIVLLTSSRTPPRPVEALIAHLAKASGEPNVDPSPT